MLELISKHNPLLKEHIKKYGNAGSGVTSYLSHSIATELSEILAMKVLNLIITELKVAKYYSISVDSTVDRSHTDQLTFVVRYVINGQAVERFIQFIQITQHDGEYLFNVVVGFLNHYGIANADCRGQGYDNAPNMSGCYSGLQARFKILCPEAVFVGCSCHSLNLVGVHSCSCHVELISFFNHVQGLYVFLSASPYRWNVLNCQNITLVLKALCGTRWSERADAVHALEKGYPKVIETLTLLKDDDRLDKDAQHQASCLLRKMNEIGTAFLTIFWNEVLARINQTSIVLQKENAHLAVTVDLLTSLEVFVQSLRTKFDHYEAEAKKLVSTETYKTSNKRARRISTRIEQPSNSSENIVLQGRGKFKVDVFFVAIDRLSAELSRRSDQYKILLERFSFIIDILD